MRTKEYMLQYRRALEQVRLIDARLAELYRQAEVRATAPREISVRGSGKISDHTADLAVSIAETGERLERQRAEALRIANEIFDTIGAVPDPIQARLLFDRYILGRSWNQTADDIGHDPVHTRGRLHGAALEAVRKVRENKLTTQYYKLP